MRRSIVLLVFLAACAGTGAGATTTETASPVTTAPNEETSTSGSEGTTDSTEIAEATTTTDSGREVAPDFTLELGDGGSYTLSQGSKPVYMVFWAEW